MRVLGINNKIEFTRKPRKDEEAGLRKTCNAAYNALGTTDRIVITHGSCFPSKERSSYIGSPYGDAAREYVKFLALYGFNGNQLGPGGDLEFQNGKIKPSPYNASAFAKNKLFIDLNALTTEKYGNILSKDTYNLVTELPNTDKDYDLSDFNEAAKSYDAALSESYKNFKTKVANGQPQALALNKEFKQFLTKHNKRLNEEAVFKILSKQYNTDNTDSWSNELDKNLITLLNDGDIEASDRFNEIKNSNKNKVEQYKFEQFIATKQIKENKEWRDKIGFKYFNDLLVGCSKMDKWRYQDAFLSDWEMGARENNSISQRWHIPVIDPKKIFKNDKYELGIGGKFLKEKINFALEFNENIRIDHAMGLIEPYLISKNATAEDMQNKTAEMYISQLRDKTDPNKEYDHYWDYPKLLTKLIIPTLKEHGLSQDMPVWEDICSYPPRFIQIYDNELHLPKLKSLDWERAQTAVETASRGDWYLIGSHDNIPAMNYLQRKGIVNGQECEYTRGDNAWNTAYLAGYLNMDDGRKNITNIRNELKNIYENNDRARVRAKFAELLTTPKFQISFADLLGINDAVYNIGGSSNKANWKERIPANYLDNYYKNLASENPTALNMPELLKTALQAKIDKDVMNSQDKDTTRAELNKKYAQLMEDLQKYADILKEPEI